MDEITYFFNHLFDASNWPPRRICGFWRPYEAWLYILSDLGIWLAYTSIPIWLGILVTKRRDVPFLSIFWLFVAFILLCGATHLLDALAFWWPAYRLNAFVRFLTAVTSLGTFVALIPVLPRAFSLRTPETLEKEIAERKRVEADLRSQALELQAVNKELEAFSYSVSHDLRAPLRSMDGFSQALLEDYGDRLDEEGRHYLQRIRAGSQEMARLIDDILNLSQVTRANLQPEWVDLSGMARNVMAELGEHPEKQAQGPLTFIVEPGLQMWGDRRLLRIVLTNLLGNAVKFTRNRENPVIEMGVQSIDGQRVFYIRDNGVGFDMAYQGKLFVPFQRLHGGEYPGSGIGLATVERIVNRHGGRIWAQSQPDEGTTFYVHLPQA